MHKNTKKLFDQKFWKIMVLETIQLFLNFKINQARSTQFLTIFEMLNIQGDIVQMLFWVNLN